MLIDQIIDDTMTNYLKHLRAGVIVGAEGLAAYIETINPEIDGHLRSIGRSILEQFYKVVEHKPGSFVKAVLDNDLVMAFTKADSINQKHMLFYAMLLSNGRMSK